MRSLVSLAILCVASPALADEPPDAAGCRIHVESGRDVLRSGDVEVRAGDRAGRVVALSGSVRVRAGATAEEVVALGGDVLVEEGALVRGDAVAFGGDVRLSAGARVQGSATSVGGRLELAEGAEPPGGRSEVRAEVNGRDLAAIVMSGVAAALRAGDCRVEIR